MVPAGSHGRSGSGAPDVAIESNAPSRYTPTSVFPQFHHPGSTPMPGMTMTEQILAKHCGKSHVDPGENIWVDVDVLMTHDVCGPGTIGVFYEQFGKQAKVWDPDKVVIIPDHY